MTMFDASGYYTLRGHRFTDSKYTPPPVGTKLNYIRGVICPQPVPPSPTAGEYKIFPLYPGPDQLSGSTYPGDIKVEEASYVRSDGVIPNGLELSQNYPNPANPSTTISYTIPTRSHVTLSVFNTLGQKVAGLVNGEEEAGSYNITFDASGLASGVYLYRMQAGSFVQTKKLVMVK